MQVLQSILTDNTMRNTNGVTTSEVQRKCTNMLDRNNIGDIGAEQVNNREN